MTILIFLSLRRLFGQNSRNHFYANCREEKKVNEKEQVEEKEKKELNVCVCVWEREEEEEEEASVGDKERESSSFHPARQTARGWFSGVASDKRQGGNFSAGFADYHIMVIGSGTRAAPHTYTHFQQQYLSDRVSALVCVHLHLLEWSRHRQPTTSN